MRNRAFHPGIESFESRDLMSGGLAGMYITGSARPLYPIPVGSSGLPGWPQPAYWAGGTIIYSPVGGSHMTAAGQFNFVGWSGNQPIYSGSLKVQNTKAVINFYGPVGNGLMNYSSTVGFTKNTSGTVDVSWAVGYGTSPDTFNFDGPRHLPEAPTTPHHAFHPSVHR